MRALRSEYLQHGETEAEIGRDGFVVGVGLETKYKYRSCTQMAVMRITINLHEEIEKEISQAV